MIYSYDQFVAIIEWINDLKYWEKMDEKLEERQHKPLYKNRGANFL